MIELNLDIITILKDNKNLLAFSGGLDSSALFFVLKQYDIQFDIAIVDYGLREQSKQEVAYAQQLSLEHNISLHMANAPKFDSHFETNARDFRYKFFETIMSEFGYNNLITAHQLNDRIEWMMMRLSKGSGLAELIGMSPISQRYNPNYNIIRPLLQYSKDDITKYLTINNITYFIDETNIDTKIERNYFRTQFVNEYVQKFKTGLLDSFEYLNKDASALIDYNILFRQKQLIIFEAKPISVNKAIDLELKILGYLLTAKQREEVKKNNSIVIGGLWAIERIDNTVFIAPYINTIIPKNIREKYRISKIPIKIRGYIYQNDLSVNI